MPLLFNGSLSRFLLGLKDLFTGAASVSDASADLSFEWIGLSLNFLSNTYSVKNITTDAEKSLYFYPSSVEYGMAMSFIDNTYLVNS